MFKATLGSTGRESVILTLHKYNFLSLASHKIIANGSYKKDSGLQCPLATYQKMQLCLTLSKNTEKRRNFVGVLFPIMKAGILKTTIKRVHWQIEFVTNHFHRVLVVVRPVKLLFDFPKSIIADGVSRKRSRVALSEDSRVLFLGDNKVNKSSKRCAHTRTFWQIFAESFCLSS